MKESKKLCYKSRVRETKRIKNGSRVKLINLHNQCEVSSLILTKFMNFLIANNFVISDEDPDVYIFNSCCVISALRERTKESIESLQSKTNKPIVLFGCFAGIDIERRENIIKIPSRSFELVDNFFEHKISISKINTVLIDDGLFVEYQKYSSIDSLKVLISQGCNYKCSYCTIKHAKGKTKSRTINDIKHEILANLNGRKEVLLISDDCGSYGSDINTNIVELIMALLSINDNFSLAIHCLYPQTLIDYEEEFIKLFKTKRISYVNITVESGSQRILRLMNRHYDIDKIRNIISTIKSVDPNMWLYTHIIINFPTETESDFKESLDMVTLFNDVLFLDYSENKSTESFNILPKIDNQVRLQRLNMTRNFINLTQKGELVHN